MMGFGRLAAVLASLALLGAPVTIVSAQSFARADDVSCYANYLWACIPLVGGDVDCFGGTGDGPRYVGPVYVVDITDDIFELDRDHDHLGCETSPTVPPGRGIPRV